MKTKDLLGGALAIMLMFLAVVFRMGAQPVSLSPATMPRIGTVDERFQAYNIEMIEVTGGRFWKPHAQGHGAANQTPAPVPQLGRAPSG